MKPLPRTLAALATVLISFGLWSCHKDTTPTQGQKVQPTKQGGMPSGGGHMMDGRREGCPMVVQGAKVTVVETDGGATLAFTTAAGDVAGLRTRVRSMAQMYGMRRGHGGMMWHPMGGKGMGRDGRGMPGKQRGQMAGRSPMPAASHTVTDTDKGAQLELRPTDPSQLDALRKHVRRHQQRMHSGECWMPRKQSPKTAQRKKG